MNESNMLHVGIIDFLKITSELIEVDLLIQNHFLLRDSTELENKRIIQLKLRNNIFRMIIIKKENLAIEAEEWYFQKIKDSCSIDLLANPNDLKKLSVEIVHGLDQFRLRSLGN